MTLRVGPGVAWVRGEEDSAPVFVAPLPDGPVSVLEGTAATIWLAALEGPTTDLAERVAALEGVPVEAVREEISGFVDLLVRQGLLTWS